MFASRNNPILNGKVAKRISDEKTLRFKNTVSKELQNKLLSELDILQDKYTDISKEEMMSLKHWVSEGNSPYTNPDYICDEYGVITDFISASRILDEAFND